MSDRRLDDNGEARLAVADIYREHGAAGLDDETLVARLLPDLLPDRPREANLLRGAAGARVAQLLTDRIGAHMPVDAAVRDVASILADRLAFDRAACLWIVAEYAIALGHPADAAALAAEPPAAGGPPPAPGSAQPAGGAPAGASPAAPRVVAGAPPQAAPAAGAPYAVPGTPPQGAPPQGAPGIPPQAAGATPARAAAGAPPQGAAPGVVPGMVPGMVPPPGAATAAGGVPAAGHAMMPPPGSHPAAPQSAQQAAAQQAAAQQAAAQRAAAPQAAARATGWPPQIPGQRVPDPEPTQADMRGPQFIPGRAGPVGWDPNDNTTSLPVPPRGSRLPLILAIVVTIAIIGAIGTAVLLSHHPDKCTGSNCGTQIQTSTPPVTQTTPPDTPSPAPDTEPPGNSLADLLPADIDADQDCQTDSTDEVVQDAVAGYRCSLPSEIDDSDKYGLPGLNVWEYQFPDSGTLSDQLKTFNNKQSFDPSAEDGGCPPKSGASGGAGTWSYDSSSKTKAGELECYKVADGYSYVWTDDANYTLTIAQTSKSDQSWDDLNNWWEHDPPANH